MDSMTAFGLKARDTADFTDVLAATATASNTNVGMMGETFKYVAPLAGSLGFNIKDTSLAIGLMANSGIKASQAGTTLRGALSRMASPPKKAAKEMSKMGLTLTDTHGKMKSLRTVMTDLRKNFKGLSKSQKAQTASNLFGQEAMSGMLAIIDSSEGDFNKLSKAIDNSSGASKKMADMQKDTLAGSFKSLSSAMEGVLIDVGEKLAPDLRSFADWAAANGPAIGTFLGNAFDTISRAGEYLAGKIEELYPIFTELATTYMPDLQNASSTLHDTVKSLVDTGFNVLKDVLIWVRDNEPLVKLAMEGLVAVIVYQTTCTIILTGVEALHKLSMLASAGAAVILNGALLLVQGVLLLLRGALLVCEGAQWLLNIAMTANPIGIVVVLIGGLVLALIALYNNCETARIVMNSLWNDMIGAGESAINGIIDGINWLMDKLNDLIGLINKIPGINIPIVPKISHANLDFLKASTGKSGGGKKQSVVMKPTKAKPKKSMFDMPKSSVNYASGTDYHPGGPANVGETGEPELVTGPTHYSNMKKGTNVIGVKDTKKILQGLQGNQQGSGNVINININGYLRDKRDLANEISGILKEQILIGGAN